MPQSTINRSLLLLWLTFLLGHCQNKPTETTVNLSQVVKNVPSLSGRKAYIHSPFVTAGDRLYMVGHQDGQFPDLGWHVTGEMGGIWSHPIKLMDGFAVALQMNGQTHCLAEADTFVNYPFANKHIYNATPFGITVERFQFVPDGKEAVVVNFTFRNQQATAKNIRVEFNGMIDLRPVWLGERTGMIDSGDYATWDESDRQIVAKDSLNDWYVVVGSSQTPESYQFTSQVCDFTRVGKGMNASLTFSLALPPAGSVSLPVVIAGSHQSEKQAKAVFTEVRDNSARLLAEKQARYEKINQTTRLTIPDKTLQQAYEWTKYSTDWLIRDVPGTGRGLSAGLPDYPWWFGADNAYALQGVLATGQTDVVYQTINLLQRLSEQANGNGRIIHEVSTNGSVFNPGNVNETPQFASLIWTTYQWTGDRAFLQKQYPTVKKGLQWLLDSTDTDGNLLPDGFGMMEIHGLNSEMIDVATYTQKAFADAANMATELGETQQAAAYRKTASALQTKINTDFWSPESRAFADFVGTTKQARQLIDDAIIRADTLRKPWAVQELQATKRAIAGYPADKKQGFVLHHNWVVNTPMETGVADTTKALAALETGSRFVNPFGVFVTGIDRDENAGKDESSFAAGKKIFSYTGAVMTLPTGVLAVAENNYGRPDKALEYLQRMTRSFGYALPGSIYEVSPDYGMMTQAWNLYSYAVPIITQFFGIRPQAASQTIHIQPQMPTSWDNARLENIIIGENKLNIHYTHTANVVQLELTQTKPEWKLMVAFPLKKFGQWRVNGKRVVPQVNANQQLIEVRGNRVVIELE